MVDLLLQLDLLLRLRDVEPLDETQGFHLNGLVIFQGVQDVPVIVKLKDQEGQLQIIVLQINRKVLLQTFGNPL